MFFWYTWWYFALVKITYFTPHIIYSHYYVDRVVFGNAHLIDDSDNEVSVEMADIFVHPEYDPYFLLNDIALIRLAEPVTSSDYVRPACLAESSDELKDYRRCLVAGWGATQEGSRMQCFVKRNSQMKRCVHVCLCVRLCVLVCVLKCNTISSVFIWVPLSPKSHISI